MVNLLTPLDIQKVETFCIKKWVLGDSQLYIDRKNER